MKSDANEGGGTTVILVRGDDLSHVPASHRDLITPGIRKAFADPAAYFRDVADRCQFPQLAKWLRALLAEGRWELQLHRGYDEHAGVGFYWDSESIRGALIGLPSGRDLSGFPASLQEYYTLVDGVHWNGFGCAGGVSGVGDHPPLCVYRFDFRGDRVDLDETFVWGYSPCGDMLIYTADGHGGWLNLGSHKVHLLGTIAETIDWVYSEMLANRGPEWDYEW